MEFNYSDANAIIEKVKDYDERLKSLWSRGGHPREYLDLKAERENFIFDAVENTPAEFSYDKEILLSLIECSNSFFVMTGDTLRYDKDILYAMLLKGYFAYRNGSCTSHSPASRLFEGAPNEVFNDRDFMLKCIEIDGFVLKYAPEELKRDSELVWLALNQNPNVMDFLPRDIHIDRNVVLNGVKKNGWNLGNVPREYENDLEILYAAIAENPHSFRVASYDFRHNEELTIEVIRKYDVPLDEISDSMWERPPFVLEMVKDFGTSVLHNVCFSETFDLDFAKKLLEIDFACYNYLPAELQENEELLLIKQKEMEKSAKRAGIKTDEEEELDARWDDFLEKLTKDSFMQTQDFQELFFDTFWYFRNRKDVAALGKGGWHILSCLSALGKMPYEFIPDGCEQNEYNAARCLSEDLIFEINRSMPGFYVPNKFQIENYCTPPAGCSPCSADMSSFEAFLSSFYEVVSDFDSGLDCFRYEGYSGRYCF